MIVLLIILIILAIIIYLPVCLDVKYIDGKLSYRVSYAFITFYPKKPKKNKSKKTKNKNIKNNSKKSKDNKSSEEFSKTLDLDKEDEDKSSVLGNNDIKKDIPTNDDKSETKSSDTPKKEDKSIESDNSSDSNFLDSINMVLDIFKTIKVTLGKFIKSFRVTNLYIDFKIANQDAYDCALNFGKMNILVYNILAYLDRNFKVKKKSINIEPKYNSSESVYDISFKVKLGFGNGVEKILIMIFKVIPILKQNDII